MNLWCTQLLYDLLKSRHDVRLTKQQFDFHLGKFKEMVKKYSPSVEEAERVVEHMATTLPRQPKIDAMTAIQDVRFKRDTGEAWEQPAPWEKAQEAREKPHPQSEETAELDQKKVRRAEWYVTMIEGATFEMVDALLAQGLTHEEVCKQLREKGETS